MTITERARRLVGDMPWVTEHLMQSQLDDLPKQIETSMMVAVDDEREFSKRLVEALKDMIAWFASPGRGLYNEKPEVYLAGSKPIVAKAHAVIAEYEKGTKT
jgi:hypothetical protein